MTENKNEPAPRRAGLLARLIGEVRWTPPPWVETARRRAKEHGTRTVDWTSTHRRAVTIGVVATLVALVGVELLVRWYNNRPTPSEPVRYSVQVTPPPLTRIEEELHPAPIYLQFSGSV